MAIKVNQAGLGFGLRGLAVGEAPSARRAPLKAESKPVAQTEQSAGEAKSEPMPVGHLIYISIEEIVAILYNIERQIRCRSRSFQY